MEVIPEHQKGKDKKGNKEIPKWGNTKMVIMEYQMGKKGNCGILNKEAVEHSHQRNQKGNTIAPNTEKGKRDKNKNMTRGAVNRA